MSYSQKPCNLGHTTQVLLVLFFSSLSEGDQATGERAIRVPPEPAPESPCYTSSLALPPAPEDLDRQVLRMALSASCSTQVTAPGEHLHISYIPEPTENVYVRHGHPRGSEAALEPLSTHAHSTCSDTLSCPGHTPAFCPSIVILETRWHRVTVTKASVPAPSATCGQSSISVLMCDSPVSVLMLAL